MMDLKIYGRTTFIDDNSRLIKNGYMAKMSPWSAYDVKCLEFYASFFYPTDKHFLRSGITKAEKCKKWEHFYDLLLWMILRFTHSVSNFLAFSHRIKSEHFFGAFWMVPLEVLMIVDCDLPFFFASLIHWCIRKKREICLLCIERLK